MKSSPFSLFNYILIAIIIALLFMPIIPEEHIHTKEGFSILGTLLWKALSGNTAKEPRRRITW